MVLMSGGTSSGASKQQVEQIVNVQNEKVLERLELMEKTQTEFRRRVTIVLSLLAEDRKINNPIMDELKVFLNE